MSEAQVFQWVKEHAEGGLISFQYIPKQKGIWGETFTISFKFTLPSKIHMRILHGSLKIELNRHKTFKVR